MPTWFTSDTHFGHEGIIRNANRAFASVEEMDEAMIRNWNSVVSPRDDVWHLGDFTLSGAESATRYRNRLNGNIHLVWGNHDRNSVRFLPIWRSSQSTAEIRIDGIKVVMCHYAMRVWNMSHYGSVMLYGHSHGNLPGTSQSLDVGVDDWDLRPVSMQQITDRLQTLPAFVSGDHHRARQHESAA